MQFLLKVTLINANIAAAELPAAITLGKALAAAECSATDTAFLHSSAAGCFWFLICLQPIWSIQLGKPGPTAWEDDILAVWRRQQPPPLILESGKL